MAAQDLFNFYISKGLSPAQAAGIAGNAFAESGYNPEAFNPAGGGQGAFGAFQWRADRQTGLRDFAKERGAEATDLMTQAEYAWHEMQTTERASLDAIMRANNPAEAAEIFRAKFERPGEDPSGYRRAAAEAQRVAQQYGGIDPGERQLTFGSAAPSRSEQGEAVFDTTLTNPDVPLAMGRPMPTAPEIFEMFSPGTQEVMGLMGSAYGLNNQASGVRSTPELPAPNLARGAPGIATPQSADPMTQVLTELNVDPAFINLMGRGYEAGAGMPPLDAAPGAMPAPEPMQSPPGLPAPMADSLPQTPSPMMGDEGILTFGGPSPDTTGASGASLSFGNLMDDATIVETTQAAESAGIVPQGTTQSIVEEPADDEAAAAEKTRRREMIGQMLMQVSKGLGQMSVGQAVDVTGIPLEYTKLDQSQQRIDIERDQEERLLQQAIIDAQAGNPQGAVQLFAAAGFEDLASAAMQGAPLNELFSEYSARTKDIRSIAVPGVDAPPAAVQTAQAYMDSYNQRVPPAEQISLDQALQMTGSGGSGKPPTAQILGDQWYEANPGYYDAKGAETGLGGRTYAQQEAAKIATPSTVVDIAGDVAAKQAAMTADELTATTDATAQTAYRANTILDDIQARTLNMVASDAQDTGLATPIIKDIMSAFGSVPGLGDLKNIVASLTGYELDDLEGLQQDQLYLSYLVAQANKGQGSITENERKQMLQQVPNLITSAKGRLELLARTRAFNDLDIAYNRALNEYLDPTGSNIREARFKATELVRSSTAPLSRAYVNQIIDEAGLSSLPDPIIDGEWNPAYAKQVLPNLTTLQAQALGLAATEYWEKGATDKANLQRMGQ